MTLEERARYVADAIEATPEATELRAAILASLVSTYVACQELAGQAAEAVARAHPDVLRDVEPAALTGYIVSQVVAIALGDQHPAVLDVRRRRRRP